VPGTGAGVFQGETLKGGCGCQPVAGREIILVKANISFPWKRIKVEGENYPSPTNPSPSGGRR
jgi:hypothetical protein